MEKLKEIFAKLWDILLSPRFISFYWTTGIAAVIAFLGLITNIIPQLGLSEFQAVIIVGVIAQITKALNNFIENKDMGFVRQ